MKAFCAVPEAFIPLGAYLRRAQTGAQTGAPDFTAPTTDPAKMDRADALSSAQQTLASLPSGPRERDVTDPLSHDRRAQVYGELGLIRLAAGESFERAARHLLRGLADEVFARELALAPIDIEALLCRAATAFAELQPVRIVVAADDAPLLPSARQMNSTTTFGTLPVRVDPALARGDFIIEVRDGALESRRSFRVQAVLEQARAAMSAFP